MRQRIISIETRFASQSDKCTPCAETDFGAKDDVEETRFALQSDKCTPYAETDFGAKDDVEGGDYTTDDDFWDDMPQHFNSMETGPADHTANDTMAASRHNLSVCIKS